MKTTSFYKLCYVINVWWHWRKFPTLRFAQFLMNLDDDKRVQPALQYYTSDAEILFHTATYAKKWSKK